MTKFTSQAHLAAALEQDQKKQMADRLWTRDWRAWNANRPEWDRRFYANHETKKQYEQQMKERADRIVTVLQMRDMGFQTGPDYQRDSDQIKRNYDVPGGEYKKAIEDAYMELRLYSLQPRCSLPDGARDRDAGRLLQQELC